MENNKNDFKLDKFLEFYKKKLKIPKEVIDYCQSLSKTTKVKVLFGLVCGLASIKSQGQVNPNLPANAINNLKTVYVFPEQGIDIAQAQAKIKEQCAYENGAWSNYLTTRGWVDIPEFTTIPMSDYNSLIVPNDIDATNHNFKDYLINNGLNGEPVDFRATYTLQTTEPFGNAFATTNFDPNVMGNYFAVVTNSNNAIGMGNALNNVDQMHAHEKGHTLSVVSDTKNSIDCIYYTTTNVAENSPKTHQYAVPLREGWIAPTDTPPSNIPSEKKDDKNPAKNNHEALPPFTPRSADHPYGKNIAIQTNYGTTENPNWISNGVENRKTIMSSGTASGMYVPVYTSSVSNVITDNEGWVHFTYNDGDPGRVQASELDNGTYNTIDKQVDYVQNQNPDLMHTQPLNNNELPSSPPQLSLNGNMLTITNPDDYPEIVRGQRVNYFVYVYHKNNVQNNQYLNTDRPGGYPLGEEIDVSQFVGQNGVNDVSDLAFTVFGDKTNSNSPASEIEAPDQAPVLPDNIQVVLDGDDATLTHLQATDPNGDPIVRYEHQVNNGNWESHGTDLSFGVNNLNIGPQSVKIRAVTIVDGQPVYSNEISTLVNVPDYAPELGGNPTATVNGYNITVTLPPATDANHGDQDFTYFVKIDNQPPVNIGNNLSYTFTNNAPGTHTIKYKAENNQSSPWSNPTTAEVENTAPLPPSNVEASNVQANSAILSWTEGSDNDPGDSVKYKVYINGEFFAETTNTTLTLLELLENTYHFVEIYSEDSYGETSSTPATVEFTTLETVNEPPTTPPNFEASNPTQTTVDLSWGNSVDNKNVVGYYVQVLLGNTEVANYETTANSMTVEGLEPGKYYTFKIRAKDDEGAYSTPAITHETTLFYPDTTPPNPVENDDFTVDVTYNSITITFTTPPTDNTENNNTQEVSGVSHINVYLNDQLYTQLNAGETTANITNLLENTAHEMGFMVVDGAQNNSEIFTITITTEPNAVEDLEEAQNLTVFPNPANNVVNLKLQEGSFRHISIYNINGQLVQMPVDYKNVFCNHHQMNVSHLPTGVYMIKIIDNQGNVMHKKMKIE